MKTKTRLFYGWYVVIAGCAVAAVTVGIVNNCFSQFIKPVCADMGITREQMCINQTIQSIIMMCIAMFWGRIYEKINLHKAMCIASVALPLTYFSFSLAKNVYMLYASTVFMSLSLFLVQMTVMNYIVGNWFVKNRGTAIGLMSMGSGIGGMIMNPVISNMIVKTGWRSTYRYAALIFLVVLVPAVWFVIKEKPEDMGLEPYGSREPGAAAGKRQASESDVSYKDAVRTPLFWMIIFTGIGMSFSINGFYQTLAPHISDSGYSVSFAAFMTSAAMGALAAGKVLLGRMFDKLGVRKATTIACCFTLIGIIGLIFCKTKPFLLLIIAGTGLGAAYGAICSPVMCQRIYGMKDYNHIYGKFTVATSLGGAFPTTIAGRVFDTVGSYTPFYCACALMVAVCIVMQWLFLPKDK